MPDCYRKALRLILLGMLLPMVAACMSPLRISDRPLASFSRDPMQIARISCFLALETPDATGLRMTVSRLELLAGDTWLPLLSTPQVFDSVELGAGQLFIGAQNVPPGDYRRLRIEVSKAQVQDRGGASVEVLAEPHWFEIDLAGTQSLAVDDSKTLLFLWAVDASLNAENRFQPALTVRSTTQQIWSDLVFISCPEIDTVFIIRADTNRVVGSFGLKGAPTYLAIDPDTASRRLFVLCARDRMIKIVDLETYRVVEFFAVPLNDAPSAMQLSPDGRSLYLLDEQSGYLTRMNTDTGQIEARAFLDFRPSYLHYLPEQNLLAVSLALSQKVLLLDPLGLQVAGAFPTGSSPAGLLAMENQLYIAEQGDNSVRVINLSSGNEEQRLPVGFGPRRLIAAGQQIYVGNALGGSLSVLATGGLGVVQTIFGFGRPGEMALNSFYRRIYVADAEQAALSVVDVSSNRMLSSIKLGALPFGLAVLQ